MYRLGHYGVALLSWAPVGAILLAAGRPVDAVLVGIGIVGLARLPDYDMQIPLLSHRGPTHTAAFALLVGVVLAGAGWFLARGSGMWTRLDLAGMGATIGLLSVGSHLLADWLTPAGIPLLWPLSRRRYSISITRADNSFANVGLLAIGVFAAVSTVLFFYR